MKMFFVVASLLVLLAPGSPAVADGTTGMVRGHVVDQDGPVAGARITLKSDYDVITVLTDRNGFFVALSVHPGPHADLRGKTDLLVGVRYLPFDLSGSSKRIARYRNYAHATRDARRFCDVRAQWCSTA